MTRPAATRTGPAQPAAAPRPPRRPVFSATTLTPDARATLIVIVATCCAVVPLGALFTDTGWVYFAWLSIVLLLAPAAALRMRWEAHIAQVLPGLGLVTLLVTARFLPDHALGGLIPTRASGTTISDYGADLSTYIRDTVSPDRSIPAAIFVLTIVMVAVAVFSDAIAVVFRAGALLAGPYLLILTLSASVPRTPVPWWSFALVAAGYLLVLSEGSREQHLRWGPMMSGHHGTDALRDGGTVSTVGATGLRIGGVAFVVALVLAAVLPSSAHNPLANAVHNGDSGSSGSGAGGTTLDPFVSLKGDLKRTTPIPLLSVQVSGPNPYYLRQLVLDNFTGTRWQQSLNSPTVGLRQDDLPLIPDDQPANPVQYDAKITVKNLAGNAPTLQSPTAIHGLPRGTTWNERTAVVGGPGLRSGERYTVTVSAPQPNSADLAGAPDLVNPTISDVAGDLNTPSNLPPEIAQLTARIVAGLTGPYAKARALSEYFTTPANGFTYTLSTKLGDSGSDLLDFLTNKQGFCQQYAAAMAVMLRLAGVPSRVVVGYTHAQADSGGNFQVTTSDAHAWVEAYFSGFGWTAFDPTPLSGADAARAQSLPYVPAPTTNNQPAPSTAPLATPAPATTTKPRNQTAPDTGSSSVSQQRWFAGTGGVVLLIVLGIAAVVLAIVLIPVGRRAAARRRRIAAATADPLWDELTATARDLGYVWSPSTSPRQVTALLGAGPVSGEALTSLATLSAAVEDARYARPGAVSTQTEADGRLVDDLKTVESALRDNRGRVARLQARFMPADGWNGVRLLLPKRWGRNRT
ncbi:Transglutaminase-like enzyme, putative cysteine protease [Frankineae bacterium MT45]|nr:Transglutaminase-like enzyme, putative cysteine protease [Frankineae bacterium MT45]